MISPHSPQAVTFLAASLSVPVRASFTGPLEALRFNLSHPSDSFDVIFLLQTQVLPGAPSAASASAVPAGSKSKRSSDTSKAEGTQRDGKRSRTSLDLAAPTKEEQEAEQARSRSGSRSYANEVQDQPQQSMGGEKDYGIHPSLPPRPAVERGPIASARATPGPPLFSQSPLAASTPRPPALAAEPLFFPNSQEQPDVSSWAASQTGPSLSQAQLKEVLGEDFNELDLSAFDMDDFDPNAADDDDEKTAPTEAMDDRSRRKSTSRIPETQNAGEGRKGKFDDDLDADLLGDRSVIPATQVRRGGVDEVRSSLMSGFSTSKQSDFHGSMQFELEKSDAGSDSDEQT